MFRALLFVLVLAPASVLASQVTGVITDSRTGKPLEGVTIFINKSTAVAISNENGEFGLATTLEGFVDVVLFKESYTMYRSSMKLVANRQYNLTLKLTQNSRSKKSRKPALVNSPTTTDNDSLGIIRISYPQGSAADAPYWLEFKTSNNVDVNIRWESNRRKAYRGSLRHFLTALASNALKENGFGLGEEALNVLAADRKAPGSPIDYQKITIGKPIVVGFHDETIETSTVSTDGPIDLNKHGLLIDPRRLVVSGAMNNPVANMLPIDYVPVDGDIAEMFRKTLFSYFEKVYVHTDKSYYYPGENIWFKTYVNFYKPSWRDSLSKTLYVEVFNASGKVMTSRTLQLDSGFTAGQVWLSDSLSAGEYQLRAYTQSQNNFGNEALFTKSLHVLDKLTRPVKPAEEERQESSGITIVSDVNQYTPRQSAQLTIKVTGKDGKPVAANLSVSVTDATQVIDVGSQSDIRSRYVIQDSDIENVSEIKYPVESGIAFRGRYLNSKSKPEKGLLNVVQLKPYLHSFVEANDDGEFMLNDLQVFDSASFSVFAQDAKNVGQVITLPRDIPAFTYRPGNPIATVNAGTVQRIISEYEVPKDVTLLEAVEVSATKLTYQEVMDPEYRVKRPYGAPDHVVKAKDFQAAYGNLPMALVGKVPGLKPDMTFWRSVSSTITGSIQPLIMIDNVAIGGGNALDILSQIDPNTVESIEFTNRINVLYGSAGRNGVINIFTKHGLTEPTDHHTSVSNLVIHGYDKPQLFRGPDYSVVSTEKLADYRSTIHWDPNVRVPQSTGTAVVSFFTSDLPDRYRVVVEGVTSEGEPVRGVVFLSGKSN